MKEVIARSRVRQLLFSSLVSGVLLGTTQPAGAVIFDAIFDDGGTHDISSGAWADPIIRDSAGGNPTTVNLLAGGRFYTTNVEDTSIFNVFDGSTAYTTWAHDQAHVTMLGGTAYRAVGTENSRVDVRGGSFTYNGETVAGVGSAVVTISGGTFSNTGSLMPIVAYGSSTVNFLGGTVLTGRLDSQDTSRMYVSGGSFLGLMIEDTSIMTVIGSNFVVKDSGGSTVWSGFGELLTGPGGGNALPGGTGSLSGVLADGSILTDLPLAKEQFATLALQAVPLPAALPLFSSSLGLLGFLGWRKSRKGNV